MSEHNPTPDSVTMHPEQIEGYDYGTDQAAISPLTIEELERQTRARDGALVKELPDQRHAVRHSPRR